MGFRNIRHRDTRIPKLFSIIFRARDNVYYCNSFIIENNVWGSKFFRKYSILFIHIQLCLKMHGRYEYWLLIRKPSCPLILMFRSTVSCLYESLSLSFNIVTEYSAVAIDSISRFIWYFSNDANFHTWHPTFRINNLLSLFNRSRRRCALTLS